MIPRPVNSIARLRPRNQWKHFLRLSRYFSPHAKRQQQDINTARHGYAAVGQLVVMLPKGKTTFSVGSATYIAAVEFFFRIRSIAQQNHGTLQKNLRSAAPLLSCAKTTQMEWAKVLMQ